MRGKYVIFEAAFRGEVFSACFFFWIEVCEGWVGGQVEGATDVALPVVNAADVGI